MDSKPETIKYIKDNQWEERLSYPPTRLIFLHFPQKNIHNKILFKLRSVNAIYIYNFLKNYLLKIP